MNNQFKDEVGHSPKRKKRLTMFPSFTSVPSASGNSHGNTGHIEGLLIEEEKLDTTQAKDKFAALTVENKIGRFYSVDFTEENLNAVTGLDKVEKGLGKKSC